VEVFVIGSLLFEGETKTVRIRDGQVDFARRDGRGRQGNAALKELPLFKTFNHRRCCAVHDPFAKSRLFESFVHNRRISVLNTASLLGAPDHLAISICCQKDWSAPQRPQFLRRLMLK